jgi:hypothetical protein
MKKVIGVLLIITLIFALATCNGSEDWVSTNYRTLKFDIPKDWECSQEEFFDVYLLSSDPETFFKSNVCVQEFDDDDARDMFSKKNFDTEMISELYHSSPMGYGREFEYENKWIRGDIIGYEMITFHQSSVNTNSDQYVKIREYRLHLNKNGIIYGITATIIDDVPSDFAKTWKHLLKTIS